MGGTRYQPALGVAHQVDSRLFADESSPSAAPEVHSPQRRILQELAKIYKTPLFFQNWPAELRKAPMRGLNIFMSLFYRCGVDSGKERRKT